MVKIRFLAIFLFLSGVFLAYFNAVPFLAKESLFNRAPFKLGLDLRGGTHLVYKADVSSLKSGEVANAMAGLRDVIERRINLFGIAEPVVQIEKRSGDERLIIELAGVSDINQAIQMIGETPFLEFKTERTIEEQEEILSSQEAGERLNEDPYFLATELTGRFLKNAALDFDPITAEPTVTLEFSKEGGEIFANLTKENIGKRMAIYMDSAPISAPNRPTLLLSIIN